MSQFVGRKAEIRKLLELKAKNSASLVVLMGRRRIGKSRLIDEVGKTYKNYLSIAGLAPRDGIDNISQLKNFHSQLQGYFSQPIAPFFDWYTAFNTLAELTSSNEWLIFLDEISWMGTYDNDFAGQLKIVWDKRFKNNDRLILALCGSVSSWIENNLLKNADFVGRVSLQMTLEELPLADCNEFWKDRKNQISALEKLKILSVTGGVPKYLEEVILSKPAEENILRLCFTPEGPLLHEFDKIFNEIFLKRNKTYNRIVRKLGEKKLSSSELAKALKLQPNGDFSECLNNLEISGFIKKDFIYDLKGEKKGISRYRLKDNYLRFYFKYIEPNQDKILSKHFNFESVYQFSNWESTVGLQFENLILQNLNQLYQILNIPAASIISASPYFQKKTARTKGACQIDLLITTVYKTIYLCELKVREHLSSQLIKEIQRKIDVLQIPRGYSIHPVLIYEGTLTEKTEYELKSFFNHLVCFDEFLSLK
jgi:AAA+ ATPase superfamily predicted ATPase